MSFENCSLYFLNGKCCAHNFIITDIQKTFCNFHFSQFNKDNILDKYKEQYRIIKNSILTDQKKRYLISKLYSQIIPHLKRYFNFNESELYKLTRECTCTDEYKNENKYRICMQHIEQFINKISNTTNTTNTTIFINGGNHYNFNHNNTYGNTHTNTNTRKNSENNDINEITFSYDNNRFEKPEDCPVCFCSIEDENEPLTCGHWVHKNCIEQWKQTQRLTNLKCPVCRADVSNEKEKVVTINIQKRIYESEAVIILSNALHKVIDKINSSVITKIHNRDNDGILDKVLYSITKLRF